MAAGSAAVVGPARLAAGTARLGGVLEREGVFSWLMLAPGVAFLLAFVAYPFFYGIFLSLQDRRVARAGVLVGLPHSLTLAPDPPLWQGAPNTFVYTAPGTPLRIPAGLPQAPLFNPH